MNLYIKVIYIIFHILAFHMLERGNQQMVSHAGDWLDTASHSDTARARDCGTSDKGQQKVKISYSTNYPRSLPVSSCGKQKIESLPLST